MDVKAYHVHFDGLRVFVDFARSFNVDGVLVSGGEEWSTSASRSSLNLFKSQVNLMVVTSFKQQLKEQHTSNLSRACARQLISLLGGKLQSLLQSVLDAKTFKGIAEDALELERPGAHPDSFYRAARAAFSIPIVAKALTDVAEPPEEKQSQVQTLMDAEDAQGIESLVVSAKESGAAGAEEKQEADSQKAAMEQLPMQVRVMLDSSIEDLPDTVEIDGIACLLLRSVEVHCLFFAKVGSTKNGSTTNRVHEQAMPCWLKHFRTMISCYRTYL